MKLEPGDSVFVVYQKQRHKSELRTETAVVTKVGRKYASIGEGWNEKKFDLETGASVHKPDSNARTNGFGFDVYMTEADYQAKVHVDSEFARLQERMLMRPMARLNKLSPEVVQKIHAILDSEGLD